MESIRDKIAKIIESRHGKEICCNHFNHLCTCPQCLANQILTISELNDCFICEVDKAWHELADKVNKALEGIIIEERCLFCDNEKPYREFFTADITYICGVSCICHQCKGIGKIQRPATLEDITKENLKEGKLKFTPLI